VHETHHTGVCWSPPTITGDNCEEFGEIPEAEEQTKPNPMYPCMPLEVGAHPVQYAFKDASGNYIQDRECTFTITVEQKAHPVILTCPGNVTTPTLLHADFGLPTWDPPVAMQGGKILDNSHISYPQGVQPNMPFPFGTTVITVKATGEITGTRTDEHLMVDECTFLVTVTDPQIPKVDGRMYRCKESNRADAFGLYALTQQAAKPYEVCSGLALDWMPHMAYVKRTTTMCTTQWNGTTAAAKMSCGRNTSASRSPERLCRATAFRRILIERAFSTSRSVGGRFRSLRMTASLFRARRAAKCWLFSFSSKVLLEKSMKFQLFLKRHFSSEGGKLSSFLPHVTLSPGDKYASLLPR